MKDIIFIVGPTAIGKTDTSFLLAKESDAEIISSDSMLVYKEPQIIVSKPSEEILNKIKHHFIGIISIEQSFDVFNYYREATQKINELYKKGRNLIVCGGSGLYVKALCDGIYEGVGKNEYLRKELTDKANITGTEYLHEELKKVDPAAAEKISVNDLKRIIRALEVYYIGGIPISARQQESKGLYGKLPLRIFGLIQSRSKLYEQINIRTDKMFEEGVVDEVKSLLAMKLSPTAQKIIGIKEIEQYLKGKISKTEAKESIMKNTRNFAKRQLTWFSKDKRIEWIDVENLKAEEIKEKIFSKI